MEIIKFLDKTFNEIPEQDNPTFNTTKWTGETLRVNECLMVCKVSDPRHSGVKNGFKVIYVPLSGEIISKGNFWESDMAELFAEALSGKLDT
tara:strand:+ start:187 stop:462 length:276 start_codon:yes stop_codon:yes gene_type:complete